MSLDDIQDTCKICDYQVISLDKNVDDVRRLLNLHYSTIHPTICPLCSSELEIKQVDNITDKDCPNCSFLSTTATVYESKDKSKEKPTDEAVEESNEYFEVELFYYETYDSMGVQKIRIDCKPCFDDIEGYPMFTECAGCDLYVCDKHLDEEDRQLCPDCFDSPSVFGADL